MVLGEREEKSESKPHMVFRKEEKAGSNESYEDHLHLNMMVCKLDRR